MKKALVIPASGIGDALLMMIAAHRCLQEGYNTKTIHPIIGELGQWFPGHSFASAWDERDIDEADWVLVENDNSARMRFFKTHRMREKIAFFYPTYQQKKHGVLKAHDQVFDSCKPMADNIAFAIARLFSSNHISKNNGLVVPEKLTHRKHAHRVAIHPTSADVRKNWGKDKYTALAQELQKIGYETYFSVSPKERPLWEAEGIETPLFASLSDLAAYLYESSYVIGNDSVVGHLGSNLYLPTLIVADHYKRMLLWRPGWLAGSVITPPAWIPNWKFLRLKRRYWKKWISVKKVLFAFQKLASSS